MGGQKTFFSSDSGYMPPERAVQKIYDYVGGNNIIYEGWSDSGSATSAAAWCIKLSTYSGNNLTAEQWAGGTTKWDKVWDNRAALSYS